MFSKLVFKHDGALACFHQFLVLPLSEAWALHMGYLSLASGGGSTSIAYQPKLLAL
jgi:hypothetical protein